MFDETTFRAWTVRHDEPNWDPLEKFLPLQLCGGFMWMQAEKLEGVGELQAYKHSGTRRYLYLDDEARPYEYVGGRYRRMRRHDAVEQALDMWWVLHWATDEEKDLLKQLVRDFEQMSADEGAEGAQIAPASPASPFRQLPVDDR